MGKCYRRSEQYRSRSCRQAQGLKIVRLRLRRTSVWRSSSFKVKNRARRRCASFDDSHDDGSRTRSRVQKLNGLSSEEQASSTSSLPSATFSSPLPPLLGYVDEYSRHLAGKALRSPLPGVSALPENSPHISKSVTAVHSFPDTRADFFPAFLLLHLSCRLPS